MKDYGKKSVQLCLILAILIGFGSCKFNEDKERPHKEPVDPPEQIVGIGQAKMQYDNYSKRRVPLIQRYEDSINRGRGYDDKLQQEQKEGQKDTRADQGPAKFDVGRFVYYDYATIKQYIAYIEQEAKAANVDISTLRLYFTNYPDSTGYVHPRQNSILLSPTVHKNDREYLFYIDDSNPEKPRAALLTDSFKPADPEDVGVLGSEEERSYASFLSNFAPAHPNAPIAPYFAGRSVTMNRGGGVPPPYNEK